VPDPLELVENKLVGRIDQITVQRLPLDRQLQLARYGIWRATGRTVNKVHYRWVKKPSIKQRQGETVDEFTDRLAADYEAREDFYSYEPPPSYITAADLLRIEAELWTWASSSGRCAGSASTTATRPPAPITGAASTSRSARAIRMRSISTTGGRRRNGPYRALARADLALAPAHDGTSASRWTRNAQTRSCAGAAMTPMEYVPAADSWSHRGRS
jgi:hypothetical protein